MNNRLFVAVETNETGELLVSFPVAAHDGKGCATDSSGRDMGREIMRAFYDAGFKITEMMQQVVSAAHFDISSDDEYYPIIFERMGDIKKFTAYDGIDSFLTQYASAAQ